jgi:hypothetical protein
MVLKELNRSKSNPSADPYETLFDTESGEASCTCRGWTIKKEGKPRECTHTRAMIKKHAGAVPVLRFEAGALRGALVGGRLDAEEARFDVFDERKTDDMPLEPMLASAMTRGQRVEDFAVPGWVMEEKFDGHRQVVTVRRGMVESRSRAGNNRALPAHILSVMEEMPDGVYDGELLVPGGKASDVTRLELRDKLVLVLFDALEMDGEDLLGRTYLDRRSLLAGAFIAATVAGVGAVRVAEAFAVSRAQVETIWARGGEGVVIKRADSTYQPGARSADWVKVKKAGAAVVTIRGFVTGDTGIAYGKCEVMDDAGRAFSVKTLNNATIREVAADPGSFVGRRLVIKFNERLASGAFRHPMFDHLAGEEE